MKIRFSALMMALLLLLTALLPCCALGASVVRYVYTPNGKALNVRTWPSAESDLAGKLAYGAAVTVEGYTDDGQWAIIRYQKGSAYVMTRYLTDQKPGAKPTAVTTPAPTATTSTTDAQRILASLEAEWATYQAVAPFAVQARPTSQNGWVNLRYAPSTELGFIRRLYQGHQLVVIAKTDNWYQVQEVASGVTGYIMRRYTTRVGTSYSN